MDVVQGAFADLLRCVQDAVAAAGPDWEERAVAATAAIIGAWDRDRSLAHLCVIAPRSSDERASEIRQDTVFRIGGLLADTSQYPTLGNAVAAGAIGTIWELAFHQMTEDPQAPLINLMGPALYLVLAPVVGRQRASERSAQPIAPSMLGTRPAPSPLNERTRLTFDFLLDHPAATSRQLARALEIQHPSQITRHLVRLERAGLVRRDRVGGCNAWTLTEQGMHIAEQQRQGAQR